MEIQEPIITSLLNTDFYKLTMLSFVHNLVTIRKKDGLETKVKFAFKNRTKGVDLPSIIPQKDLEYELFEVMHLRFNKDEIAYLKSLNMFSKETFSFLRELRLPPINISQHNGEYIITGEDSWDKVILWETLVLSIVNELYYRNLMKQRGLDYQDVVKEGRTRLQEKIRILQKYPLIRFMEFGTRRRFAKQWQDELIQTLAEQVPAQLIGTSNVDAARRFGLRPLGTMAHELFMVISAIHRENAPHDPNILRASHNRVLQEWFAFHGEPLSIALTDTYGTEFFFKDMEKYQAEAWRGLRHDSGDPIEFGENALDFYKGYDIDPTSKMLTFSDGLDVNTIVKLHRHFQERVGNSYGWGTDLTADVGYDLKSLSSVMKAVEVNGIGTVKLSDNLAKAMGTPDDVALYKDAFGYNRTYAESLVY